MSTVWVGSIFCFSMRLFLCTERAPWESCPSLLWKNSIDLSTALTPTSFYTAGPNVLDLTDTQEQTLQLFLKLVKAAFRNVCWYEEGFFFSFSFLKMVLVLSCPDGYGTQQAEPSVSYEFGYIYDPCASQPEPKVFCVWMRNEALQQNIDIWTSQSWEGAEKQQYCDNSIFIQSCIYQLHITFPHLRCILCHGKSEVIYPITLKWSSHFRHSIGANWTTSKELHDFKKSGCLFSVP